jgi:hypothetical protein
VFGWWRRFSWRSLAVAVWYYCLWSTAEQYGGDALPADRSKRHGACQFSRRHTHTETCILRLHVNAGIQREHTLKEAL